MRRYLGFLLVSVTCMALALIGPGSAHAAEISCQTPAPQTVAYDQQLQLGFDCSYVVDGAPVDGTTVTITHSGVAMYGTVSDVLADETGLRATYTAGPMLNGSTSGVDWLQFSVTDGEGPMTYVQAQVTVTSPLACNQPAPLAVRPGQIVRPQPPCWGNMPSLSIVEQATLGTASASYEMGAWNFRYDAPAEAMPGATDTFVLRTSNMDGYRDIRFNVTLDPTANSVPSCSTNTPNVRAGSVREIQFSCPPDAEGDVVSLSNVAGATPLGGSVTALVPGQYPGSWKLTYTAPATVEATALDQLAYTVSDDFGGSAERTTPINVNPADYNNPPSCGMGSTSLQVYAGGAPAMVMGCYDPDSDPLTYTVTTQPAFGEVTFVDGQVRYAAPAGSTGMTSFVLDVSDGFAGGTSTLTVNVNALEDSLSCSPAQTVRIRPGKVGSANVQCQHQSFMYYPLTRSISDIDTSIAQAWMSSNGGVSIGGVAAGATSVDVHVSSVADPDGVTVTVPVEVDPTINAAPTCMLQGSDSVKLRAGTSRVVTYSCTDADGDGVTVTLDEPAPTLGGVAPVQQLVPFSSSSSFTYTAGAQAGTETVVFEANDAHGGIVPFSVNVEVLASGTNTAPACSQSGPVTMYAGASAMPVHAGCSDAEGDPLSFELITPASIGTAMVNDGLVTYQAPSGATGSDSFRLRVSDDQGSSTEVDVAITIATDAIMCQPSSGYVTAGAMSSTYVGCSHLSGGYERVNLEVEQAPDASIAEVGISNEFGLRIYGYAAGTTTAVLRATSVRDTVGATSELSIQVAADAAPNAEPTCSIQQFGTLGVRVNETRTVRLWCSDSPGDVLTAALDPAKAAVRGTTTIAQASEGFTVEYAAHTVGADAFDVVVSDDHGGEVRVRVTLQVSDAVTNTAPLCLGGESAQQVYSSRGVQELYAGTMQCGDAENDAITLEFVSATHGITGVTRTTYGFTFTPPAGLSTSEATITYRAVDSRGAQGHDQYLRFAVIDGSDACDDSYSFTLRPGATLTTQLPCMWTETGSTGDVEVLTAPAAGVATVEFVTDGLHISAVEEGETTMTLRATSPFGAPAEDVSVTITVAQSANEAPWCSTSAVRMRRGATRAVRVSCFDSDRDPLQLAVAPDAQTALMVGEIGQPTYTDPTVADAFGTVELTVPADAPLGSDALQLTVSDGRVTEQVMSSVDVLPTSINTAPRCWTDSVASTNVTAGMAGDVWWYSCWDDEGDQLTFDTVTAPQQGTVGTNALGTGITYAPDADYVGADTFTMRATDALGAVSGTYQVDVNVVAPPVTITSGPSGIGGTNGSFAFTTTVVGGSAECRVDEQPFRACTSPYEVTGVAEGTHTVQVRALSAAGAVVSPSASRTWTVDATPPATTLDAAPSGTVSNANASFEFSSEAGATFECSLDGATFAACTSPHVVTGLTDGEHDMRIRARDAAGNVDPTGVEAAWTVDRTAPDTTITSAPASLTNSTSAMFGFVASEEGATFECRLDEGSFAACSSPHAVATLGSGQHRFEVRAIDALGNADAAPAVHTWTVDTVAPVVTLSQAPSGTTGPVVDVAFTANDASATFQCRVDAGTFAACESPLELTGLTDGSHTFSVRASDAAGNTGTSATATWTVDATAPETTIDAGPTGTVVTRSAQLEFSSNDAQALFECSFDGSAYTACASPRDFVDLTDGAHVLRVRAVDEHGNTDATPAERSWIVDTTAPETTLTRRPSGTSSSSTASIAFTANEAAAAFECRIDGGAWAPCTSPVELTGVTEGEHTYEVRATDTLGHVETTPATATWTRSATSTTVQVTTATVESGDTVEVASASAPLAATIATPVAGEVQAELVTSPTTTAPTGYSLLGSELNLTAPPATSTSDPLKLTFVLAAASIPAGTDTSLLRVLRNGVAVTSACAGEAAVPTPCERSRATLGNGDLQIVIYTMQASQWVFAKGTPAPAPPADGDGDGIADAQDCAPADATKPNQTGTDANCDGVVDTTTTNDPPPAAPIATRVASANARVLRYRCPRTQIRNGVRVGRVYYCFRFVAVAKLVRTDNGTALRGHTIRVTRRLGTRWPLVGAARTNYRGLITLTRPVIVPRTARRTLTTANRWIARQYVRAMFTHVPPTTAHSRAPGRSVLVIRR